MNKSRIFTSVDLPLVLKSYLKSLQDRRVYWIKWMEPRNFHITLNFLGDLKAFEISAAAEVIEEIAPRFAPLSLRLEKIISERDMLWAVVSSSEILLSLQEELNNSLHHRRLGKTERRRFAPHVLLGKSKTGRRMSWRPSHFTPQDFMVDRINLYESRLTPGAATHILIKSFPLHAS